MKQVLLLTFYLTTISIACKSQTVIEAPPDSLRKIYVKDIDPEAQFPGDSTSWVSFLQKNLQLAVLKANGAPPGTYEVKVRFIVDIIGRLTDFAPETNNGYGIEAEVIRVIKSGPKWSPAMRYGRKVNSYKRKIVTVIIP